MKLPVGIQDFYNLQKENYTYVDKTKYIYDLKETEWLEYPVIKISFARANFEIEEDYEKRIENLKENALKEALNQIEQKCYSTRFSNSEKNMFKVGVVFSKEGNGLLGLRC